MIVFHRVSGNYTDVIKGYDERFPETVISLATKAKRVTEMPAPGENYVRVERDGDLYKVTSGGVYFPYGDLYVTKDIILLICSETAHCINVFYVGDYDGGNEYTPLIFPTGVLTTPYHRATGVPALAWSVCPGGFMTLDPDEMLYGYDAEHYIFKNDEMVAVAGVRDADIPYWPYPADIKSATFIQKLSNGSICKGKYSLLGHYTSPEDGIIYFDNSAKAVVESFRTCVKKGLPFSNLGSLYSRKLVTRNGLQDKACSVLFGSNKCSDLAVESVYVGASAESRISMAIMRADEVFDEADLYDVHDEVMQILEDANLEGDKAYVQYYDEIVTTIDAYVDKTREDAIMIGKRVVAESAKNELGLGDVQVTVDKPLLEVEVAEKPARGGMSSEEYVNVLLTKFGRGLDPERMETTEKLAKDIEAQVTRRLAGISDAITTSCNLVNKAFAAIRYNDTRTYTKSYWAWFSDHSDTFAYVLGSEVLKKVTNVTLAKDGDFLNVACDLSYCPCDGINYKVGESEIVSLVRTSLAEVFSELNVNAVYLGLGDYHRDRGESAWWLHDKQTGYHVWGGAHEYRNRYKGIDRNYDVAHVQKWRLNFQIKLPATRMELDLSGENSAMKYFQSKATAAKWVAYAKYVTSHLSDTVEILKDREPFVRCDGVIYTLRAAAAFGIPLCDKQGLDEGILTLTSMMKPENMADIKPCIELLEFIRATITDQCSGITPLTYITESDLENSVTVPDPDCLPVVAFSVISAS